MGNGLIPMLPNLWSCTQISILKCLGTELSGCGYVHPLDPGASRPCLHGDHVVMTSGTGLVHTAPAHGQDDFRYTHIDR